MQHVTLPEIPETLNDLHQSLGGVHPVIEHAKRNLFAPYIERPTKPRQPKFNATSTEVKHYSIELAEWEAGMELWKADRQIIMEHDAKVCALLESFLWEESRLNAIPEQYRAKVWNKAYQDGHSSGYGEVFNQLLDLVEIF